VKNFLTTIILFVLVFVNNVFAKEKPQAGIFIENHHGMIVLGHPRPGITKQRYYFGHRWNYEDFNNDGIKDFLYSGTMRPTNIKTTGKTTAGACGGKKCDGDMPGPTLYLGQENGSFVDNSKLIIDKREPSGQSLSRQQLIADFNNDGILDFYLADHGIGGGMHNGFRDSYFLSQKNGTWLESSLTHLSKKKFKIFDHGGAVGDIDNDGDVDIVLTDLERFLRCLYNDGSGKMKIKKCGSINAFGIELGDFDNDGDLDIVHGGHEYEGTITGIALNNGKGKFKKKIKLPVPEGNWGTIPEVSFWDLDNDGDLDIVISRAGILYVGTGIQVIENLGENKFNSKFYILLNPPKDYVPTHEGNEWNSFVDQIRFSDLDNDNLTDIILIGPDGKKLSAGSILKNEGSMNFKFLKYKEVGNPIKIVDEEMYKDDPSTFFERFIIARGKSQKTESSKKFKKFLSDKKLKDFDLNGFENIDEPLFLKRSGASLLAYKYIEHGENWIDYDILVEWDGLKFPISMCLEYYSEFNFAANRASLVDRHKFAGLDTASIPSYNYCRGKRGYLGGWEIKNPIKEIGIDTLLVDLNYEVMPILANIPQLSFDQRKELLTNLDKNIN
jgi:hypothetical protein